MAVTSQMNGHQDSVVLLPMRPANPVLRPMKRRKTQPHRKANRDGADPRPMRRHALVLQPMQRQLTPAHRTTNRDDAAPRPVRPGARDLQRMQRQRNPAHRTVNRDDAAPGPMHPDVPELQLIQQSLHRSANLGNKHPRPMRPDKPAPQPTQQMTIAQLPTNRDDAVPPAIQRVGLARRLTLAQRTLPRMVSPTVLGLDLREALAPMEQLSSVTRVAAPRL